MGFLRAVFAYVMVQGLAGNTPVFGRPGDISILEKERSQKPFHNLPYPEVSRDIP